MALIPVTSKLSAGEIEHLDQMVSEGWAASRSDAIRRIVSEHLKAENSSKWVIRPVVLDMEMARRLSGCSGSSRAKP